MIFDELHDILTTSLGDDLTNKLYMQINPVLGKSNAMLTMSGCSIHGVADPNVPSKISIQGGRVLLENLEIAPRVQIERPKFIKKYNLRERIKFLFTGKLKNEDN